MNNNGCKLCDNKMMVIIINQCNPGRLHTDIDREQIRFSKNTAD